MHIFMDKLGVGSVDIASAALNEGRVERKRVRAMRQFLTAGLVAAALAVLSPGGDAAEAQACTDIAAIGGGEDFSFSGTIARIDAPPIDPANLAVAANPPCDPEMDLSHWSLNPLIVVYFDALPEACMVGGDITVSGRGYVYEHGQNEIDFYVENTTLDCS